LYNPSEYVPDNDKYIIRKPVPTDAKDITDMISLAWFEIYPNKEHGISRTYIQELSDRLLNKSGVDSLAEKINAYRDDPYSFMKIAKDTDGNVIGYISAQLNLDEYELQNLFVKAEAHGTGLAMRLWNSFLQWADDSKTIWLEVTPYTKRAPSFYKKIGFEFLENSESFSGETKIPMIVMVRKN
jgi:ribosomal protein S18 acetylase RimI-like enzyme